MFEGGIGDGARSLLIGSQVIPLPAPVHAAKPALRTYANRSVVVGIRPEDLPVLRTEELSGKDGAIAEVAVFEGHVDLVEALGSEQLVHFTSDARLVELGSTKVDDAERPSEGLLAAASEGVARVDARAQLSLGGLVRFRLEPTRIHFFDPTTGEAISD
jgi:multiple sugar transport system ATP-binding protein